MQVRAHAGDELAGERFLRVLPSLRAESQIVLDGIPECLFQLRYRGALEGNDIPSVDDFAVEDSGLVIVLDTSNVSLVFHHGVTPASVENRRIERKAPLSVSFWGWGRWKTARTPLRAIRTRDPLPSETS